MFKRVFPFFVLFGLVGFLQAQPSISIVSNAAANSVSTGNVARGDLSSIYGSNLAASLGSAFAPTSPVLSLGGASVTIGRRAAPGWAWRRWRQRDHRLCPRAPELRQAHAIGRSDSLRNRRRCPFGQLG